ncbi:ROK family protein [Nocardia brasiliensis]|uniref:ROK family protein n=1 Tax=Nocardia brasiliensis TaxID=37326 RepID=A0A6G9Y041_NOCBR|nr:ROK family protein [Nocardia brasiliensis]QIS06541.1 ROK family protein [Nocardia brasiliensis]
MSAEHDPKRTDRPRTAAAGSSDTAATAAELGAGAAANSTAPSAGAARPAIGAAGPTATARPGGPSTWQAAAPPRPATLPEDALVLGLDVGGTTIKGEITDRTGEVLAVATVATPQGEAAFEAMGALGDQLLAELSAAQRDRVRRAAVVLPGIVDSTRSIAVFSSNVGWRDVHIGDRFVDRWGIPVLIEHDVAVAGWAEWRFGAGRGHDNVCVVILGTGISGTLSVGGQLVRSGYGQVGEYGHIPVRPDGLPCPCGNTGCVETVASGASIARAYTRRTGRETKGAAEVFALVACDPDAKAVLVDAVDALADGLIGIVHAACPELIILGGGLAGAGAALTDPLHQAIADRLRLVPAPRVVLGAYGARAGLMGAALLARQGALA